MLNLQLPAAFVLHIAKIPVEAWGNTICGMEDIRCGVESTSCDSSSGVGDSSAGFWPALLVLSMFCELSFSSASSRAVSLGLYLACVVSPSSSSMEDIIAIASAFALFVWPGAIASNFSFRYTSTYTIGED